MTVYFNKLGKYGQLGNSLFQLAATIGTAQIRNDTFSFPYWEHQDCFNLPKSSMNQNIISCPTYNEPVFDFVPVPNIGKNINLHGYYQSELYFKHCSNLIKEYLTPKFKGNFDGLTAIHVRRTDYLTHAGCYNILTRENYYDKAMATCLSDKYVIFSDDLSWCKEHFKGSQFIFSEERHPVKDLSNMISCSNHIIANSSFSWWGAWLSSHNDKVIAPATWFGPKLSPTHNTKDLIPKEWCKI